MVDIVEWNEWDAGLSSTDPVRFPDYTPPAPGQESVRTGLVTTDTGCYVLVDCEFSQAGGTMGVVAGEKITRAFREATRRRLPVALLVSSGGARLQEGPFSLVQMARTVSAQEEHRRAGLLSAAVLRSPTTGGVYASWASGASIRAGVRGAVIGFGGPRVVETVTGVLPTADSHTSESAFAHGLIDELVDPGEELTWLERALGLRPATALVSATTTCAAAHEAVRPVPGRASNRPRSGWDALRGARRLSRPTPMHWASWLTDGWVPLHGAGRVVRAGIASISGIRTVVVAMDLDRYDRSTARLLRPDDFRLAQRAIALASDMRLPLLTIIDTPGADPSPASEAGGLASEISRTLAVMASTESLTVALCTGEGGSGGAMAFAHADRFYLLEDAVFEVIGPEAGATILHRDPARAPEVANSMAIRAQDLFDAGLCDGVLTPSIEQVREVVWNALGDRGAVGRRHSRLDAAVAGALTTRSAPAAAFTS